MAEFIDKTVNNSIAREIMAATDSYITSMRELFYNTYMESSVPLSGLSEAIFLMATGFIGSLGLLVTFYLLYVLLKLLRWIVVGSVLDASSSSAVILDGLRGRVINGNNFRRGHDLAAGDNRGTMMGGDLSESKRWLRQATCDLSAARNDFEGEFTAPEWVCYKCQQALEKALKAYTICMRVPQGEDRWSHDLCDLARVTQDTELVDMVSRIQSMTGLTSAMRYPDFHPSPRIPHEVYKLEQAINVHRLSTTVLKRVSSTVCAIDKRTG